MLNSYIATDWSPLLALIPEHRKDVFLKKEYYDIFENKEKAISEAFVLETSDNLLLFPYFKRKLGDWVPYTKYADYYDLTSAYGYGGIAFKRYDPQLLHIFFEEFQNYCRANQIVNSFTRIHPLLNNEFISSFSNSKEVNKCVYVETGKTIDLLHQEFKHSVRKSVRKARVANVIVKSYDTIPLEEFCGIYNETMKRNNAEDYYYFSEQLIQSIEKKLRGNFVIYIAYLDDKPISTELVLKSKKYWYSFLGGTLIEYMKTCANSLIKYHIIKDATDNDVSFFLIGGGKEYGDNIFKFKSTFAPNSIISFYINCSIFNNTVYNELIKEWEEHHPEKVGIVNLFQRYLIL